MTDNLAIVDSQMLEGPEGAIGDPESREPRLHHTASAVLIDGDDTFRQSLCQSLARCGIRVVPFAMASSALKYLAAGKSCDIVLVGTRIPDETGLLPLRRLRASGMPLPIIVLTSYHGPASEEYEEAAFESGADDFVPKSATPFALVERLERLLRRPVAQSDATHLTSDGGIGPFELKLTASRAYWRGAQVSLSITELKVVRLLVTRVGEAVTYREIYDIVHGKNFIAGEGPQGYRANVRAMIRRIRRKFHEVDANFDEIQNYCRYGYRWRGVSVALDRWRMAS